MLLNAFQILKLPLQIFLGNDLLMFFDTATSNFLLWAAGCCEKNYSDVKQKNQKQIQKRTPFFKTFSFEGEMVSLQNINYISTWIFEFWID